jgi:hypothetical protein
MRSLVMCGAAVVIAGCSSNPTLESPAQQSVHISTSTGRGAITVVSSSGANVHTTHGSIDRVWKALPMVYDSLSIPLTIVDSRTRVIGNEGFKIRRRLGKTPLSRYLECGRSQMDQNADEYEITMSVITRLAVVDSQQTKVTTMVEASAKGLQFAGQASSCTSRGALEAQLQQLLMNALWTG